MTLRWQFDALQQGWHVRLAGPGRVGKLEIFVTTEQAPVFLASVAAGISAASPALATGIMEQFDATPQSGRVVLQ